MIHFSVPKWADWSEWSDCSMTCNFGIRTRSKACQKVDWRDADLPMPSNRYTAGNGSLLVTLLISARSIGDSTLNP